MNKRMNKERAREILEKIKSKSEEYIKNSQTRINTTDLTPLKNAFVRKQEYAKEKVQALDIAIDSLDNEWVDVRDRLPSEEKWVEVTLANGSVDVVRLVNIKKFEKERNATIGNAENFTYFWDKQTYWFKFNEVIAWRVVEPYERKE